MQVPCRCGHALHWRKVCADPDCECATACPDYVAGARAAGREPTALEIESTRELEQHFSWRSPGGITVTERECAYCQGTFTPRRSDALTCSGDCRKGRHDALKLECDADVKSPCSRRGRFSSERRAATGWGYMTANERLPRRLAGAS